MPITLEQKLKALREVEEIYAMSKKWQRLTPDEKRPNWERIADNILRKAMSQPIIPTQQVHHVQNDKMHHEHSPRTARMIERTLQNGTFHPDALHSYQSGFTREPRTKYRPRRPAPSPHDLPVQHIIQHGARNLHYPDGHLQGYGFIPQHHEPATHILVEPRKMTESVPPLPTKPVTSFT